MNVFDAAVKAQEKIEKLEQELKRYKMAHSFLSEKFMHLLELSKGHVEAKDPQFYEDCAELYDALNNHNVLKWALEAEAMSMELAQLKLKQKKKKR